MLLARLSVLAPGLLTLAVVSPRRSRVAVDIARDLTIAAQQRGRQVRLIVIGETQGSNTAATPSASDFADLDSARAVIRAPGTLTIICGRGLLDDASVFVAAAAAEGVLLVASQGKTMREDLARSRSEIEQAGGRILGGVLSR